MYASQNHMLYKRRQTEKRTYCFTKSKKGAKVINGDRDQEGITLFWEWWCMECID